MGILSYRTRGQVHVGDVVSDSSLPGKQLLDEIPVVLTTLSQRVDLLLLHGDLLHGDGQLLDVPIDLVDHLCEIAHPAIVELVSLLQFCRLRPELRQLILFYAVNTHRGHLLAG